MSAFAGVRPLLFLSLFTLIAVGCSPGHSDDEAKDVKVDLTFQPDPPKEGDVLATVLLTDKEDGKPIKGARLELEGNMNHAGMKPVFADAKEVDPGKYQAKLELTMPGDWYVEITATLADGRKLKRKIDVPGVKSR